jgi:hypothetical protein
MIGVDRARNVMHKLSFEIHEPEVSNGGKLLPRLVVLSVFVLAMIPLLFGVALVDSWISG